MLECVITATATILVAVIEVMASRERKQVLKASEQAKEREQTREKMLILLVQSTGAAIALSEATALAMQRGHTNGEMEAALRYATDIKRRQKDFLLKKGIQAVW